MHPSTTAPLFIGALLAIGAIAPNAAASFSVYSNFSSWANQAGGSPTQADLWDYLPPNFPTQQVSNNIFSDVGLYVSSTTQLVAHDPDGGGWYITTDMANTVIELEFATPQSAVWLTSGAITPNGMFLVGGASKSFYSGNTLVGSTNINDAGVVSSVLIDRVVITPLDSANIPGFGPFVYYVPAPSALALLCVGAVAGSRRRRV